MGDLSTPLKAAPRPEEKQSSEPIASTIPGDNTESSLPDSLRFTRESAVLGKELHYYGGNRVLEHTTSTGQLLALKVNSRNSLKRSEADMMHYAATHGVLAPKVLGVYDIVTDRHLARAIVSERLPGKPLAYVWSDLSEAEQTSIKEQLRAQIQHMRTCTQPYVGRIGRVETRNLYETDLVKYCGPFDDEESFDNWCLRRLDGIGLQRWRYRGILEKKRKGSSGRFVLTHGNLSPRNIMVDGTTVTGIIDWAHSGFYPEHVEYASALGIKRLGVPDWWLPVLQEVLEPCSESLVKLAARIEGRIGSIMRDDDFTKDG
jgi:aminoglycoside phosphotransferase